MVALASPYAQPAEAQAFWDEHYTGTPVKLLLDPDGAVADGLGVSVHPEYLLVDEDARRDGAGAYVPFEVLVRAASARG